MYQSLKLFQTAQAMAQHAGARQALTAQNIANADTPGYHAREIASFMDRYQAGPATTMKATRPGHSGQTVQEMALRPEDSDNEAAPNGNTVSLEDEIMNAVNIAREHNRALTIYRHTMTILRTSLGR